MQAAKLLLLLAGLSMVFATNSFPLFKQCDNRWGNDTMGTVGPGERSTICGEGCAMSSLSMSLAGLGVVLPDGNLPTPKTVNAWLVANEGYVCEKNDCNNLVLNAPERITSRYKLIGENPKPSFASIQQGLASGSIVYLAHVKNNHHFVLLTGHDPAFPDSFMVNDPFYPSTTYPYANISDIIMYAVQPQPEEPQYPKMTAVIPDLVRYPSFKQCNSSWGSDIMEKQTICSVGCLMSSVSMAIAGWNIQIDGKNSNPAVLNQWLRNNHGYVAGDNLEEEAVPNINTNRIVWPTDGMHPKNDLSIDTIRKYLDTGRVVIANVMKGHHFVLTVGYDKSNPDTFYVNDPGFDRTSYSYANDIVGWRLFDMK